MHIGIDRVSDSVFRGYLENLRGAENDARAMRDVANDVGCSARLLLGREATRTAVLDTLTATVERLAPGDLLVVTFAGHGVSLRGVATDPDGWDEAWCLYDGVLLDDELHELLADVPAECEVVIVTDACFAAGIVDEDLLSFALNRQSRVLPGLTRDQRTVQIPAEDFDRLIQAPSRDFDKDVIKITFDKLNELLDVDAPFTFTARAPRTRGADRAIAGLLKSGQIPPGRQAPQSVSRRIRARVVALSAADEGELAFEAGEHGLFTAALLSALDHPESARFSYQQAMSLAASVMAIQVPTLGSLGTALAAVRASPVFTGSEVERAEEREPTWRLRSNPAPQETP